MSFPFNAQVGLIIIPVRIWGPLGDTIGRFALDTGATSTLANSALLLTVGYDPATSPDRIRVTTGSGVEYPPRLAVDQIETLGLTRTQFRVVAHTLPPTASVDGLVGLDFLRGHLLTVDFKGGLISLR